MECEFYLILIRYFINGISLGCLASVAECWNKEHTNIVVS